MNDEELATGLRNIAEAATPPPGAITQILRGVQRRQSRRQMSVAAGGVVVLAGAAAITAQQLGATPLSQTQATTAKTPSPAASERAGITPAPVARPITPERLRHFGIVARVTSDQPTISYADAIRAAVGKGERKGTPVAELYRVTNLHMGRQLEPDPAKPSRIEPEFKNRLTWIVTFPPRRGVGIGPYSPDGPREPLYTTSTLVTFIDANTGTWMFAAGF